MSNICDDLRAAILQALIYDPEKCPEDKKEYLVKLADLPVEYLRGNGLRKTDIIENGKYECILYGELFMKYHDGAIDDGLLSKTNAENTVKSRSGDILIPGTSTASKEVMLRAREIYKDGVEIGGDINIVRPKVEKMFYPRYISYVFDTFSSKSQLFQYITGTTGIIHISNSGIKNLVFYLPPLAEQKRIVEKVDEFMARVTDLEQSADALASLKKAFPDDIKASLLQYAMQGKLTKQLPEDGDAEDLLEEIKAEKEKLIAEGKIKKQKPLAPITDDEIPFSIPENWKWVGLSELGLTQTGNTPSKTKPEYFGKDIPFIGPGDIKNNTINYDNQGISKLGKEVARIVPSQSILQVCIGGSIGKSAITDNEVAFNQQINSITAIVCSEKYLSIVMNSNYFIDLMKEKAGGTATPILNRGIWDTLPIPVPPLPEQKRIVERLDSLIQNINAVGELIASE